jgi:hypothetical protein
MLLIEKEAFDGIMKALEKKDKKIEELLKGKETENKPQNKMIVFIEDTDPILDLEGNEIGPFKKGDIANLAEEVATILIGDKKADSVDED